MPQSKVRQAREALAEVVRPPPLPPAIALKYEWPGKPGHVPHAWATLGQAVEWIHVAGGQAVVAHPGRYTLIDLNRYVSPGGKYAESIDGIRIRGDGVHFTMDGAVYVSNWLVPQLEQVAKLPTSAETGPVEEFDPRHLRAT